MIINFLIVIQENSMIIKAMKKSLQFVNDLILDKKAEKFLKNNAKKTHDKNELMKVGFIVFEPETWDKLNPIYNELKLREGIEVKIIIVPSFDQELKITTHYGKELNYFKKLDNDSILAYQNSRWIDIEKEGYDYIFYQDPYNEHMPPTLRSDNVVRFAKICYVPYGFVGSNDLSHIVTNKAFFRNVTYGFLDTQNNFKILTNRYKNNIKKGLQHFNIMGYPAYEKFFEYAKANNEIKKILWAPRWTYDEKIGKSHFFEYKDKFNELSKKYPNILFTIRPHPMMFSNFIKSGLMTEEEFLHYKKELELLGIELSLNKDVSEDLKTTDILISDFSSIIPMFYFMNKPVIYTDADMALNEEYCIIMDNSYIADNWNKVREYIDDLVNGIDLKSSQRYADIKEQYKLHHEASRKIVDCLVNDYIKNEMEA